MVPVLTVIIATLRDTRGSRTSPVCPAVYTKVERAPLRFLLSYNKIKPRRAKQPQRKQSGRVYRRGQAVAVTSRGGRGGAVLLLHLQLGSVLRPHAGDDSDHGDAEQGHP